MNDPGFSLTFCMKENNNNNNSTNNNKATEYNIIYPVRLDIVFVFCTGVILTTLSELSVFVICKL